MSRTETLSCIVATHYALSFIHIRREPNKVVDLVENIGVDGGWALRVGILDEFENEYWVKQ